MIHSVDPRQNRLFDPFQGVIPPAGQRIIAEGWQGIFRHVGVPWAGSLWGLPPRAPTEPDVWNKKLISSHLLDPPPKCL